MTEMIKRPGSWLLALLLFAAVCLLVSCGDSAPSDPGYDYDSDGHWYKGGEENKTAHTFYETVIPPTCTESGYTLHRCVCGYSYESDPAKPLGHTFSDTLTYDETGHWYPAVCGHADEKKDYAPHCYYTEVNKGPTCHPPVMVRTENEIVTPPTETEEGYTTHFCACGYSYRDSFVPPRGQTAPTAACNRGRKRDIDPCDPLCLPFIGARFPLCR